MKNALILEYFFSSYRKMSTLINELLVLIQIYQGLYFWFSENVDKKKFKHA